METEALNNQRSDVLPLTKQTRKISTNVKPLRKISTVRDANDVLKDTFQRRISRDERPDRKVSMNWPTWSEEKANKATKFQPKMENTYKLDPDITFPYGKVKTVMAEALHRHLHGSQYDHAESSHKAKLISEDIKAKVKAMNISRYRIICLVHIGCNQGQELKIVSRSLWNPRVDTFATANFKYGNLFAVATVFGVYFE